MVGDRHAGVSLSSASALIVALATLFGYFLAFAWRGAEAAYYGIPYDLISVSVEDGLRYVIPLVLLFICYVVVISVDYRQVETWDKRFLIHNTIQFVSNFVAMGICLISISNPTSDENVVFQSIMLFLLVISACFLFIAAMRYILVDRFSMAILLILSVSFIVFTQSNTMVINALVIFITSVVMLVYVIKRDDKISLLMKPHRSHRLINPLAFLTGSLFVAGIIVLSVWTGFYAAGNKEHLVLSDDAKQVVLTTYSGDRSVIGTIDDDGNIVSYRMINLSDDDREWRIEKVTIAGRSFLPLL